MGKYDLNELQKVLEKRGAKFKRSSKEVDATHMKVGIVGIDTLGKLEYLAKEGYMVLLPPYRQQGKTYRGLSRP